MRALPARYAVAALAFAASLAAGPAAANLLFSSYLGGDGPDHVNAMTIDAAGAVYLVGDTGSTDFPAPGGQQTTLSVPRDAFLVKLSAGNELVYGRYLNLPDSESFNAVAIGPTGTIHAAGHRDEDESLDCLVVRFSAAGAVERSNTIGGTSSESCADVAVDAGGNTYVVGSTGSTDLPVTSNAPFPSHVGERDGFFAVIAPDGSLTMLTYLGGSYRRNPTALVLQGTHVVIAGFDGQASPTDSDQAFVMRLDLDLVFPEPDEYEVSFGGTFGDYATDVVRDTAGDIYVVGYTQSVDFPTTPGVLAPAKPGSPGSLACFAVRLSTSGAIAASTFNDEPDTLCDRAQWSDGALWIGGRTTTSTPFFLRVDAALARATSAGRIEAAPGDAGSTSLQGLVVRNGRALVAGVTDRTMFPLVDAFGTNAAEDDSYVAEFVANPEAVFSDGFEM